MKEFIKCEEKAKGIAYHLQKIVNIFLSKKESATAGEDISPLISFPELLFSELGDDLVQRLNTPDDKELFDQIEHNRKKVLDLMCGKWKPEVKTNMLDVTITRTPDNDYEMSFENGAGVAVSVGFLIRQQYDSFFIKSGRDVVELDYYSNTDQIRLNNTFFDRKRGTEDADNRI
jgi:hypothetical protein